MGGFSLIHWLILGVVILLLFGGNRFSSMMGDVAKGLKSFKQGMSEDDRPQDPRALPPGQQAPPAQPHVQQQHQQQYSHPPIDLTPQAPHRPDPVADPARGVPPSGDGR